MKVATWTKIYELHLNEDILLNVRSDKKFHQRHIENAVHIPVDDIRNRLNEIPKDKNIYIYCQIGLRGYLAQRILLQNNFLVKRALMV